MRIQNYLTSGKIDLKLVKYLVLDEADKMLSIEFYDQLKGIFDKLPKKKFRQNLLFSATFNEDVKGIAKYCLNNYYYFNSIKECPKTIKHMLFYCKETEDKFQELFKFLNKNENKNKSILIFMNNKKGVDEMMKALQDENIQACSIHGAKTPSDRNKSIRDFSLGYKKILVSTDLISRGLDFPNIYCVINFDVPNSIEDYIHRIGRTGRLGQKGLAITYLDRIDDTNKENLINLLNNLGQEIPSWINDVEYQKRFNFYEDKKENYLKNDFIQETNYNEDKRQFNYNNQKNNYEKEDNNEWKNNNGNNYNNKKRRDTNNSNNWNNNNNWSNDNNVNNYNNKNRRDTNNKNNWNNNNNWSNDNNDNNYNNKNRRDTNNKNNWNNNNSRRETNNNNNWSNDNNSNNWNNSNNRRETNNSNNWSNQNNSNNWNDNNNWSNDNNVNNFNNKNRRETNNNNNWSNQNNSNNYKNDFRKEERNQNNDWNTNRRNYNRSNRNNNENNNQNLGWDSTNNKPNNNEDQWKNKDIINIEDQDEAFEELFIRGINYKSDENDIRNTFSKYGDIVRCKILRDKETNKSRGIGFVKFKEKFQACNAMKDADNIECQGRKLKINYSNDKTRKNNDNNGNNNYKNRSYENKRNNNFTNNKKEENNDVENGWSERNNERERSREKIVTNEDIDSW